VYSVFPSVAFNILTENAELTFAVGSGLHFHVGLLLRCFRKTYLTSTSATTRLQRWKIGHFQHAV